MVLSPAQYRAGFSALVEPQATAVLLGQSPGDLTDGFSPHTSLYAVCARRHTKMPRSPKKMSNQKDAADCSKDMCVLLSVALSTHNRRTGGDTFL